MRNTLLASLLIAFVALFSSQQALATGYKYHSYKSYSKSYYTPYYKKSSHKKHYYQKSSHKKHYKKKYYSVKPRPVSGC